MGQIALRGMKFHAKHGFYEEENIIGGEFIVDVSITTSFGGAAKADDLEKTINYETVYKVVEIEMRQPAKLLETLIFRIQEHLKEQFYGIEQATVQIKKLNPPVGGQVEVAIVVDTNSYTKNCGKCGGKNVCYGDDNCWCQNITVHPRTQKMLSTRYKGCLCKNCIVEYSN